MNRNDQPTDDAGRREGIEHLKRIRDRLRKKLADFPFPCADRSLLEKELKAFNVFVKAEIDGRSNVSAAIRPRPPMSSREPSEIWLG